MFSSAGIKLIINSTHASALSRETSDKDCNICFKQRSSGLNPGLKKRLKVFWWVYNRMGFCLGKKTKLIRAIYFTLFTTTDFSLTFSCK